MRAVEEPTILMLLLSRNIPAFTFGLMLVLEARREHVVFIHKETTKVLPVRGTEGLSSLATQSVLSAAAGIALCLKGLLINICLVYRNLSIG